MHNMNKCRYMQILMLIYIKRFIYRDSGEFFFFGLTFHP